jgi:hypothetical protein
MARPRNSRFAIGAENVDAINWGLVTGKSNTIYAWDEVITGGSEPVEWFHDIFCANVNPIDATRRN